MERVCNFIFPPPLWGRLGGGVAPPPLTPPARGGEFYIFFYPVLQFRSLLFFNLFKMYFSDEEKEGGCGGCCGDEGTCS